MKYVLETSKSGKSLAFIINIDDRYGKQSIKYTTVTGWRCKFAKQYLSIDSDDWDNDTAMKFICMRLLKISKNSYQALQYINQVKSHSNMELHFWAAKFLSNDNAIKSWLAMYD